MKMKKFLPLLLVLVLLSAIFAGCLPSHYLEKVAAAADKYSLVLSYDSENHKLSAVQTVEMTNNSDNAFESVKFHIFANIYREDASRAVVPSGYTGKAYKNGKSYGDITFDSVKVGDSAVAFVIEGEDFDILSVPVETFYPNEKLTITMVYEIRLANILHRLGYGDNTVNLGNFYPVLCNIKDGSYDMTPYYAVGDPFVTEMANYDVTLTVPADYLVASTGDLVDTSTAENENTYRFSALAVRDFAMVLSSKFFKLTQSVNGVMINYYYFADKTPEVTMAAVYGTLQFMGEKVADYPYNQISVVETDFCYGGMEYPNLVMIRSGESAYLEATVHEVIHQWFYGLVGNDQIEDAWMDEGLTEFLTILYFDYSKLSTLGVMIKQNAKAYAAYVDVLKNYFGGVNTAYRASYEYKNDQEYVYITYVKGSLMFYGAYNLMGEAKFYKALEGYFDNCKASIATSEQMIAAFSKANGADMTGFFNSYIEGKEQIFEKLNG